MGAGDIGQAVDEDAMPSFVESRGQLHQLSLRPASMKLADDQPDGKLLHVAVVTRLPAKPDHAGMSSW